MQSSIDKLFEIAESQQGYFTTKQAKACGYEDNTHPYHVQSGNWIRVYRGIYRLAKFPQTERPDLIIWALWSTDRKGIMEGVFSHETALTLHALSDIMPDKIHMTVPKTFRRRAPVPPILILHYATLKSEEIIMREGVLITTVHRTLIDSIMDKEISHDLIIQSVKSALNKGMMTRSEFKQLLTESKVKNSPIFIHIKDL